MKRNLRQPKHLQQRNNFVSLFLRRSVWLACIALVLGYAGCVSPSDSVPTDETLLTINGQKISRTRFQEETDRVREELGDAPVLQKEVFERLRQRILQQLIEEVLLSQQAHLLKLTITDAAVDAEIARLHGKNKNLHRKILRQHYKTEQQWRQAIRRGLLREKVAVSLFPPPATVAEKDIIAYWKQYRKSLRQGPEIFLSQIVVAKKGEAEDLYRQLRKHPNRFEALAKKHSITPEGRQGGHMGWVRKNDLPRAFSKAFRLPAGKIGRPVKSPYGYHLFWVRKKRAGERPRLTNHRREIIRRIKESIQTANYKNGMMELTSKADIQIRKGVLARVHW